MFKKLGFLRGQQFTSYPSHFKTSELRCSACLEDSGHSSQQPQFDILHMIHSLDQSLCTAKQNVADIALHHSDQGCNVKNAPTKVLEGSLECRIHFATSFLPAVFIMLAFVIERCQ